MRIAFFTPLAPVNSGTADYASELLPYLRQRAEVDVFIDPAQQPVAEAGAHVYPYQDFEKRGGPQRYDVLLYAIANNPFHLFAYRMALRHPGVVLLHDFNLHHLLAHVTIVENDWEEYFRLVEEEGGAAALERARLVQQAITGPDYDNLNLNRRLLRASRGVIVHSDYVKGLIENAGLGVPVRMIRHGVKRIEAPPEAVAEARRRLGLPADELLIGSFGFVKPYKRISSCLKALSDARRELPPFHYLLVGEKHPDYPVQDEIERLGLQQYVLRTGRVDLDTFWDYIFATDICLNLRYPTAGETSGSLLREMAAGKAIVVSNVGAFGEWPDNCVAKADIDANEIPQLTSYLKLLGAHPSIREQMGRNAQAFVRAHCSWERAADAMVDLLAESVEAPHARGASPPVRAVLPLERPAMEHFILNFWTHRPDAQDYARAHMERIAESLAWVPRGRPAERLLEMGCYLQMTPVLAKYYGYGEVRGAYAGERGRMDACEIVHAHNGEHYCFAIDKFDAERDPFPYPNNTFRTVLCCELIEHLAHDPMHMLFEINRILLPEGFLLLSTPNTACWKSVLAITRGDHPNFFPAFLRPTGENGRPVNEDYTPQEFATLLAEAGVYLSTAKDRLLLCQQGDTGGRHAREYTPKETQLLLTYAGFEVVRLETRDFYGAQPVPEELRRALVSAGYDESWSRDTILVLARKAGPPRERYPREFYA